MTTTFLALGTLLVVVLLVALLWSPVSKYFRTRGDRVVSCPDNGQSVAVRVDAMHAALSHAGRPDHFRVESCSRWPAKAGCGRECLSQIEAQPDDCLVRTQVSRWYADKTCAFCGKAIAEIDWTTRKPAVRTPEGITVEWQAIDPATLPALLASCSPVCWDCHIAETFRRERPDLVIDNPLD